MSNAKPSPAPHVGIADEAALMHFVNETHARICAAASSAYPPAVAYATATRAFGNGFVLDDIGDAGMVYDTRDSVVRLSRASVAAILANYAPAQIAERKFAVLQNALHEGVHIAQGIGDYADVKKLKNIAGPLPMAFLDLQSTTIAVVMMARVVDAADGFDGDFAARFKRLWVDFSHPALGTFPIHEDAKGQRLFGYLIKSAIVSNWDLSGETDVLPLALWPQWSPNRDQLIIFSDGRPIFTPPIEVEPALIKAALVHLRHGNIDEAYELVQRLAVSVFGSTNTDIGRLRHDPRR